MHASVHELKARLSHYLKLVARGEQVIVTSRGRPIARLVAAAIPGIILPSGPKPRGSKHAIRALSCFWIWVMADRSGT